MREKVKFIKFWLNENIKYKLFENFLLSNTFIYNKK